MNRHIFLDLETLALGSRPAIVQIGLVVFNAERVIKECNWYVGYTEDIRAGGEVSEDTKRWWAEPGRDQTPLLTTERVRPGAAVYRAVTDAAARCPVGWWANGIDFVWLESMWTRHHPPDMLFPVPYNLRFDMRTLRKTVGRGIEVERDPATMHDALQDALWGARWLQEAHRRLGGVL